MKRGVNGVCSDHNSPSYKRLRRCIGERDSRVTGNSDPFAVPGLLEHIRSGKYGSVTKDVEALIARKMQMLQSIVPSCPDMEDEPVLENEEIQSVVTTSNHIFIIDSDEENDVEKRPPEENDAEKIPVSDFQETLSPISTNKLVTDPILVENEKASNAVKEEAKTSHETKEKAKTVHKTRQKAKTDHEVKEEAETVDEINEEAETVHEFKDKGLYLGVKEELSEEDEDSTAEDDGLSDIWKEMNFAIETSRDVPVYKPSGEPEDDDEGCDHSFVLKDDIGYLCRVCGVIKKPIETIFDFQYKKAARVRSYRHESRLSKEMESSDTHLNGLKLHENGLAITEVCPHPRHKKQMKPHQLEGFNFLLSNLVSENPGGCILAHAPGSGKTFMIISFMQSFLARYPDARPLVVLPKGILSTWKKEFQRWQVEDIPLLDFYSAKADSRAQQSEVLKQWVGQKSVLFLGYQQFSLIVSDDRPSTTTAYCRDVLLKCPSIMILDEGHNPRNDNTDMLNTLASVVTPRKVVLSGTLYQNHVKEVFTILNLVRPKFLKLETSRTIQTRILSRVSFDWPKKSNFYDLVEQTLQQDSDFKRKEAVIKDLREMTSHVLHYYRGDFLDDLPGLLDFTVLLQLKPEQKHQINAVEKNEKQSFRKSSMGCAIYTHPILRQFLVRKAGDEKTSLPHDGKIDKLVESIDWRDGVKAKFFYNVLGFCESTSEKLLVFSQYLLPLKFLERLAVCKKGYAIGKEIFTITGDTSAEQRETSMEQFNTSTDSRVLFGSIKACGEGISLVGASRVIILDVHLNPSVSRQAIGRAFRPGQEKKVHVYRLVAADSPEEKDHLTCFRKEQIAKRWFEWNEYSGNKDYELEKVDPNDSGDMFLESDLLSHDIQSLFTR